MLICILTKNVITSCSVTMMLFLHLEVKPLMTLTTVLSLSCALISGHLAMMLMELAKRRRPVFWSCSTDLSTFCAAFLWFCALHYVYSRACSYSTYYGYRESLPSR